MFGVAESGRRTENTGVGVAGGGGRCSAVAAVKVAGGCVLVDEGRENERQQEKKRCVFLFFKVKI